MNVLSLKREYSSAILNSGEEADIKLRMKAKIASIHNKIEILDEENVDLIVAVLVALDKIVGDRERVMRSSSAGTTAQGSASQG